MGNYHKYEIPYLKFQVPFMTIYNSSFEYCEHYLFSLQPFWPFPTCVALDLRYFPSPTSPNISVISIYDNKDPMCHANRRMEAIILGEFG